MNRFAATLRTTRSGAAARMAALVRETASLSRRAVPRRATKQPSPSEVRTQSSGCRNALRTAHASNGSLIHGSMLYLLNKRKRENDIGRIRSWQRKERIKPTV